MRDPHSGSVGSSPYSMLFVSVRCGVLTVLLSSCSVDLPVQRDAQQAGGSLIASPYSIVCVIHGDGDYGYHDTSGTEYTADEEALEGAKRVAQQNPQAEVFIFHQRPSRHFLFFFPLRDGAFYYYRNGQLVAHELYWRDQEQSQLEPEVRLYRRFRVDNQREMVSMFLYFGHEIPEIGGRGYDASYPDRTFTVHDLASGTKGFTRNSARFDLMVLSTCFGGSPYTIGELGSFARTIVASPDNLHLSYFDIRSLERLDLGLRDGDVPDFAARFAHQAFDRLTKDVQTAVSVAVYDVDRVQEFLRSVSGVYEHSLTTVKEASQTSNAMIGHCDCADLPSFVLPTMNQGVEVLYRPARFGRSRLKQNHSGWECWKDLGPKHESSQTAEPVLR